MLLCGRKRHGRTSRLNLRLPAGLFGGQDCAAPRAEPKRATQADGAFGFVDQSVQCERHGTFRVSADGRTLTNNFRRRAVAVASCGSVAVGLIDGASFEVTLTSLKRPAVVNNSARLVGVAPAGALNAGLSHVVPTSGVHASSDGVLWVNGYKAHNDEHAKFGQGDTIRCQVLCGLVRFWKNGQLMFEAPGVTANVVDVFPTVTLAALGDTVRIDTPTLYLPLATQPCDGDPLASLFTMHTLLSSIPDQAQVHEEWKRSRSTADIQAFLLERRVFVSLPQENLRDVSTKLVKAIRDRMTIVSDRHDPIHAAADARVARLMEMAKHVLHQPGADFVLPRVGPAAATKHGAGEVSMYSATLFALIIATHEVAKLHSTEAVGQILESLLAGINSVEHNALAIHHPACPTYICEENLDSLANLLGELMHGPNGPAAVTVAYQLARKRRRFRDVLALCVTLSKLEEPWARAELSKVQQELIEATASWTALTGKNDVGRVASAVPPMWTRKPGDTACNMLDAYTAADSASEPAVCKYYSPPKLDEAAWAFIEAPQGGILQAVDRTVVVKPKPKKTEEQTDAQLWQLDSRGRLINAACKQLILEAFPDDPERWDQQAKFKQSDVSYCKDTVWEVSAVDSRGWGLLCATSRSGKTAALTQPSDRAERGNPVQCSKHSSASQCANQLWRMVMPARIAHTESAEQISAKERHEWLVDPCRETLTRLLDQVRRTADSEIDRQHNDPASLVATLKLLHGNVRALVPATAIQWQPAFEAETFFGSTCSQVQCPDGSNCIGFDFVVKVQITVRSLGAFLGDASKLTNRENPLSAQLWDRQSRTLLGSVGFSAAAPGFMQGGYVFKELAQPVILPEGFEGTVSAVGYDLIEAKGWYTSTSATQDLVEFVGSGRTGTSTEFPETLLDGRAVAFLGGNMMFAANEQVESRVVDGKPDFSDLQEISAQLFEELSSSPSLAAADADGDVQWWSQTALHASAALVMETTTEPHSFLASQLQSCTSAQMLTALLERISTSRAALEYLGSHKGDQAPKNLEDTAHCMAIIEQLIALCSASPAHGAAGSAVALLAKIQAGIGSLFLTDGARIQSVFDQYTNRLALVANEQLKNMLSDGSCTLAELENTTLRLWSSWAVVLGSLDSWNCLTSLTMNAVLALVKTLMTVGDRIRHAESQITTYWLMDLQLSLGHYAVCGLAKVGKPDVQLSPRLQQWSVLLQNGRTTDASSAISRSQAQALAVRCQDETSLDIVETGSPAASMLVVALQCLLHHCSIDISAIEDKIPVEVVRAYEVAHALAMQELALETEIGLERSHSQRVLDSMESRAEFLLQYNPAPAEDDVALTRASSASHLARASSARSSGTPLQRQSSRRLWKRSSHTKIQVDADQSPKLSAALSDAEVDVSPGRFAVVRDVADFIRADEADEDLSFVASDLSAADRTVMGRRKMFGHLATLLQDTAQSKSGLNLRRRVANSLLDALEPRTTEVTKEDEQPKTSLHPMDSLTGCPNDDAVALSKGFGDILTACLAGTDDFEACANAASFCFVFEDHQWIGQVWDQLTEVSRGRKESEKCLADHLRFAMAATVSASSSHTAEPTSKLVVHMIHSCCETLRSSPQADALSILAVLLPQQASLNAEDQTQVDSRVLRELLAVLFGVLARAGRTAAWNSLAPPAMVLLQRILPEASPALTNAVLAEDVAVRNLLRHKTNPDSTIPEMVAVADDASLHAAVDRLQARGTLLLNRAEVWRWFISTGFGVTERELDEVMGSEELLDMTELLKQLSRPVVSTSPTPADHDGSKEWCLEFLGHLARHGVPTPPGLVQIGPVVMDSQPLGCESGLPDDAFSCSTQDGSDFHPYYARLNYAKYWCAKSSDSEKWIGVDFGRQCHVDAVGIQAAPRANEYCTKFTVSYSADGEDFISYNDGQEFDGNAKKGDDVVKHIFDTPFLAQHVRICVKQYESYSGVRMEWYGAESKSKSAPSCSNDCILLARRALAGLCTSEAWCETCSHFLKEQLSSDSDSAKDIAMLMAGFADVLSVGAHVSCGPRGVVKRVVSVHPTGKSAYLLDRNGSLEQEQTCNVSTVPGTGTSVATLRALLPVLPQMFSRCSSGSSLSDVSSFCLAIQGVSRHASSPSATAELMQSDCFEGLLSCARTCQPMFESLSSSICRLDENMEQTRARIRQLVNCNEQGEYDLQGLCAFTSKHSWLSDTVVLDTDVLAVKAMQTKKTLYLCDCSSISVPHNVKLMGRGAELGIDGLPVVIETRKRYKCLSFPSKSSGSPLPSATLELPPGYQNGILLGETSVADDDMPTQRHKPLTFKIYRLDDDGNEHLLYERTEVVQGSSVPFRLQLKQVSKLKLSVFRTGSQLRSEHAVWTDICIVPLDWEQFTIAAEEVAQNMQREACLSVCASGCPGYLARLLRRYATRTVPSDPENRACKDIASCLQILANLAGCLGHISGTEKFLSKFEAELNNIKAKKTTTDPAVAAVEPMFRGQYRYDDTMPYNYTVEMSAAGLSTGEMEVAYTCTKHPNASCVGWKGIETYSVRQDDWYMGEGLRYLLTGTGKKAGNDNCLNVALILGDTPEDGFHVIHKPGCLECTVPQDDASFVLAQDSAPSSMINGWLHMCGTVATALGPTAAESLTVSELPASDQTLHVQEVLAAEVATDESSRSVQVDAVAVEWDLAEQDAICEETPESGGSWTAAADIDEENGSAQDFRFDRAAQHKLQRSVPPQALLPRLHCSLRLASQMRTLQVVLDSFVRVTTAACGAEDVPTFASLLEQAISVQPAAKVSRLITSFLIACKTDAGNGLNEAGQIFIKTVIRDVYSALQTESEKRSTNTSKVNDEGAAVALGAGTCDLYYCGRRLGQEAIPGSDGMCGPSNGPQCRSCKRYQDSVSSTVTMPTMFQSKSRVSLAISVLGCCCEGDFGHILLRTDLIEVLILALCRFTGQHRRQMMRVLSHIVSLDGASRVLAAIDRRAGQSLRRVFWCISKVNSDARSSESNFGSKALQEMSALMLTWDGCLPGALPTRLETLSSQQIALAKSLGALKPHPQSTIICDGLLHVLKPLSDSARTLSLAAEDAVETSTTGRWRCAADFPDTHSVSSESDSLYSEYCREIEFTMYIMEEHNGTVAGAGVSSDGDPFTIEGVREGTHLTFTAHDDKGGRSQVEYVLDMAGTEWKGSCKSVGGKERSTVVTLTRDSVVEVRRPARETAELFALLSTLASSSCDTSAERTVFRQLVVQVLTACGVECTAQAAGGQDEYTCVVSATVRKGAELTSPQVDNLQAGDKVICLRTKTLDDGTVRLCFNRGPLLEGNRDECWVSIESRKSRPLMSSTSSEESAARAKYESMPLARLRNLCEESWLNCIGSKRDLVDRLVANEKPAGGWPAATEYEQSPGEQPNPPQSRRVLMRKVERKDPEPLTEPRTIVHPNGVKISSNSVQIETNEPPGDDARPESVGIALRVTLDSAAAYSYVLQMNTIDPFRLEMEVHKEHELALARLALLRQAAMCLPLGRELPLLFRLNYSELKANRDLPIRKVAGKRIEPIFPDGKPHPALTVGIDVSHRDHLAGVLLGWKVGGQRIGDTGGGLSSDGFCRIRFADGYGGSGYNVAAAHVTFRPPEQNNNEVETALDDYLWGGYGPQDVCCGVEPEPEPTFELELEPEPEPEPELFGTLSTRMLPERFTRIASGAWEVADDVQLVALAKAHPLAGDEIKPPKCPSSGHTMRWSDFREGVYAGGWSCNGCGSSSSNFPGGFRWFCQECNDDFCSRCNPSPAPKLDLEFEDALADSQAMEKYPRIKGRAQADVLGRLQILHNLSSSFHQMLPYVDLLDEKGYGKNKWVPLRMLMLPEHKQGTIESALDRVKNKSGSKTVPSITIDRTKARWAAKGGDDSIFVQIYKALGEYAKRGQIFTGQERWWSVSFVGEHVSDAGGGFRETVSNLSDDLNSDRTPLMIPTPNNVHNAGNLADADFIPYGAILVGLLLVAVDARIQRHAYMPNPSCQRYSQFEFVGRLMAGAIQTEENVVAYWPPFVWKLLSGFTPSEADYASGIDQSVATYADIASCSADEFELQYEDIFTFEVQRSDGLLFSLNTSAGGSGADVVVTMENRREFVAEAVRARLNEIDEQVAAIRRGMLSARIPPQCLALWNSDEFELQVCGSPAIPIEVLKKQTRFSGGDEQDANKFWSAIGARVPSTQHVEFF